MAELIQKYPQRITDPHRIIYNVFAYGERRDDNLWEGWIEFHPENGNGPTLRTGRETTQPDRAALAYWASGLEPLYFEGALVRALERVSAQETIAAEVS